MSFFSSIPLLFPSFSSRSKKKKKKLTARLHKHPPVRKHRVFVDGQAGSHAGDASLAVGPANKKMFYLFSFRKVFQRVSFEESFLSRHEEGKREEERTEKKTPLTRARKTECRPRACRPRPSPRRCPCRQTGAWRRGRGICLFLCLWRWLKKKGRGFSVRGGRKMREKKPRSMSNPLSASSSAPSFHAFAFSHRASKMCKGTSACGKATRFRGKSGS